MKLLSPKNISHGPGSTILGAILIIVSVYQWTKTHQWTEGHTAICTLGVAMLFAPDTLRKGPQ